MRILITGMSGAGKSAVIRELRHRGFRAYDADDDGFSEPAEGGAWRWRVDAVADLLTSSDHAVLFFAGCSDEQALFQWDRRVLLTAPESVLITRLQERSSNGYGKSAAERARVLRDLREVEPMLRGSADEVIDTTQPVTSVVDRILATTEGNRAAEE